MTGTAPVLQMDDPAGIERALRHVGWIDGAERVHDVARAGEGNMNLVVRVRTSERSLILKQSRPWVEKYPHIKAPADRIFSEVAFYRAVASIGSLSSGMPRLIAFDESGRMALFEDLGDVRDFTSLYDEPVEEIETLRYLLRWLSTLHGATFPGSFRSVLRNRTMRALNHAHLFVIPLDPTSGLDLDRVTPGLARAAEELQANAPYVEAVTALGAVYLEDGDVLLHGDFYPGSWVRSERGPQVIDPEFAFFGPAEYDVGVLQAHLMLAGFDDAFLDAALAAYQPLRGFDETLAARFAGMEIMRRLIGVAQLPLHRTLDEKCELLQRSEELVLGPRGS